MPVTCSRSSVMNALDGLSTIQMTDDKITTDTPPLTARITIGDSDSLRAPANTLIPTEYWPDLKILKMRKSRTARKKDVPLAFCPLSSGGENSREIQNGSHAARSTRFEHCHVA
eukprot:4068404-Prymnesium_polylepis.1